MAIHEHSSIDLEALAHRAMQEAGFVSDIPAEVRREAQALDEQQVLVVAGAGVRDLRSYLWSSIDNRDTRDFDQVEYVERGPDGTIRVLVGIADVDAFVRPGSALDRHAFENTTSVYTGVETFPMLPEELSTDKTSLVENADRLAVVVDLAVAPDGTVRSSEVYRALVGNDARLDYDTVGAWLDRGASTPDVITAVPGLEEQLRLQNEVTEHLCLFCHQSGALSFGRIEVNPVIADGQVVDLAVVQRNRAREIIENFMVTANIHIAQFLEAQGVPSILRVVREPARWLRIVELAKSLDENLPKKPNSGALAEFLERRKAADPEHYPDLSLAVIKLLGSGEYVVQVPGKPHQGHFGLATHDYTHATAPNRRYADLVIQRLVKATIAGDPAPYTEEELGDIAQQCNAREDAAKKVERRVHKAAEAVLLSGRIGEVFEGLVTGASAKGTWVRLLKPPVEGRVMRGTHGLDVGDKVQVRLIRTDPERGFIDFERVK